jgi:AcrR family transcriptional regulator
MRATRNELRTRLITAATDLVEADGPEALQARAVAAAARTSTQSLYTLFGGTPGLIEALVADGFMRFGRHVAGVPDTTDPVADHFTKGWAYCQWAFAHPQQYRLMFGLTGGALRPHAGLEMAVGGALANFAEGRQALDVLIRSVTRVIEAGRIRPADPVVVAGQFLSATHGMVLLHIAGAFGDGGGGDVLAELAVNLMVGLGGRRSTVQRSLARAMQQIAQAAPA